MKKLFTFLPLCYLFVTFVQQVNGQETSKQKAEIKNEIDSVFHSMIKAAEVFDYDILARGTDDLHKAGFISNDSYYNRFDSLLDIVKTRSTGLARQTISIQNENITVLSGTIALLAAYGDAKIETNNGDSFSIKFYWSFVYEKMHDQWKVIQSHQSGYRL